MSFSQGRKKDKIVPKQLTGDDILKAESTLIEAEKQLILENYTKAYDLFLLAKDLNPQSGAVSYKLSEVMVKNGDTEKGLEYIDEAIELDPQNKYYYIYKAEILKLVNDFDGAAEVYEILVNDLEGNKDYLYDLASIYQFQNEWDKALDTYNRIEVEFGQSFELLSEKQKIYLRQNDMQSFMRDWNKFLEEHPYDPAYILDYTNTLIANSLFEEATKWLAVVRERFPENDRVYLLLSEMERQKGNKVEGLALLKEPFKSRVIDAELKVQMLGRYIGSSDSLVLLQLDDRVNELVEYHPDSYRVLAFAGDYYLEKQNSTRALDHYIKAVEISPDNYSVWQNIMNLEADAGNYDSLLVHSDRALEYFPNQSIFYYFNGFANYVKENHKRAAYSLEQGKKYTTDPGLLTIFYGQLGDVYHSLGDHTKSDAAYESALENDPMNFHVLNNYSYYLSLRETNMERAKSMSEKLVNKNPNNGTYLDTYGWVLYVMGEYKAAEKVLKKATEKISDGTIVEHYGDVLFKLGEVDKAIENWEKAKQLGGTSEHLDKKIEERKLYE